MINVFYFLMLMIQKKKKKRICYIIPTIFTIPFKIILLLTIRIYVENENENYLPNYPSYFPKRTVHVC